jgi:phage terminase large subunit
MLFGGARAAKTFLAVYILIVRACLSPKSAHIVVRNTFNSVKNSIWLETLPKVLRLAFPDLPVKWDKSNYRAILPNDSIIRIFGLDDGDKLERLLGLEMSTILVEECNQVSWVAVQKIKSRLAEKNILVKKVFYTQNPTTTSSAYYQAFEQRIDPVDGEAFDEDAANDYLAIKMSPKDNIENLDPEFVKMLERLPEKERLRFLLGEYDSDNSGAAVYAFNREDHVTEEAKKLQGTDWVGSDFNIEHNSDVLVSQHATGIYVWDEIQIAGDTFQKCDALKRKGVPGATVICDSTGKNRSTKGKSDHIIMREAGFKVQYKTNPAVVDKIANLNRCFTLGLIKINPRCKKLIRDLTQLVWDKNGQLDQKTDTSLSHLVDALAYLCWTLYPLISRPKELTHSTRR